MDWVIPRIVIIYNKVAKHGIGLCSNGTGIMGDCSVGTIADDACFIGNVAVDLCNLGNTGE